MKHEQELAVSPQAQAALGELEATIREHYPDATFQVRRSVDDPEGIHLWTTVDVEDTDQVLDCVIDRVMAFQIDEGLPLHVIPVRPHARIVAMRDAARPPRTRTTKTFTA